MCQSSFIWPHLPLEIDILFQLANINHQTGYCWSAMCCVCVCQSSFIWPHLPLEIDILFQLANINHHTGYCWSAVCCVCVNHRSSGHTFSWRLTSCSSWPASNIRQCTVGQPCVVCVSIIVHLATPSAGDWHLVPVGQRQTPVRVLLVSRVLRVCQSSFIWPHLPLEIDILFLLANIKHMTGYCRLPVGGCVLCVCQSSFIWPHLPLEIDMFQLTNIKHQSGYCWSAVCCVCVSIIVHLATPSAGN